jgi:nucleoside-diphosphate-sugar epimerase
MKSVLITGASGFVGYHLILAALEKGYRVTAAVRPSSNVTHLASLPLSYANLDFSDKACIERELEKGQYDFIVHNAGATRAKHEQDFIEVNAVFTKILAEVAVHMRPPIQKFVLISSLAAYGPKNSIQEGFISEQDSPKPVTNYGKSKLKAEELLQAIPQLNYLIFRPTAVYGPRERDLLHVFRNVSMGVETYLGRKPQKLSFVYVSDFANLVIASLESKISRKGYFVSDGNAYDQYQLAYFCKKILQKRTIKLHVPMPMAMVLATTIETTYGWLKSGTPLLNQDRLKELSGVNWTCDIQLARNELGFLPQYNLEEGLKETIKWYKQNNWM